MLADYVADKLQRRKRQSLHDTRNKGHLRSNDDGYSTSQVRRILQLIGCAYRYSDRDDDSGRLYDENDVQSSWQSTIAVDYHQDIVISGGLRFTPYHAGHVLGASMFMIEIAGLKILYTGDYSREEDRHLVIAEVPPVKPDVMICESTFGVHTLPDRKDKEEQFTSALLSMVR